MVTTTPDASTADDDLTAANVAWDITPLLPEPGDDGIAALLARADTLADDVATARGTIATLDAGGLARVVGLLAEIGDTLGRAENFVHLAFSVDTRDPQHGARLAHVEERATAIGTKLLFFELEWADVDDARADELLADERLAFARHHLRSARRYRPHLLTEPEEVVLHEKYVTGASAWVRLFDELTSAIEVDLDGTTMPLAGGLAHLHSSDPTERAAAAAAVTDALAPGLRTRAYVYNTLLADKNVDDRLRKYDSWVASRNLANEASDESVAALSSAVEARYGIAQRWYSLKAKLLGVDRIKDYDRLASVSASQSTIGWTEARGLVLDAYASFSGELAGIATKFFDEGWIDAPARPGKRGGAFCAYTVPSHHPYLLLNWTSRRGDVLTLAHELGHGLHAYLAREQGIFHQTTPLTLAETASVFGETVTFGRLLEQTQDPNERLALLAESLEGAIATVFRQISMFRFEDNVHGARRQEGELSVERLGELWYDSQHAMLGDAVEITDGYRSWWSYIPHFIGMPGYVYAYAYGQLLALSVYARYEARGADFVPAYLEMLAAGGSMPPEELGKIVDCDLADPGFWDAGLDIVERQLQLTIEAAEAAGRL